MRCWKWVWGVVAVFALCGCANAADICKAVALRDVPSLDDPGSVLRKGDFDEAVTQYRIDKKTGLPSICSHGGYCYPTAIIESGKQVDVLQLTNCKIGKPEPDANDEDYLYYDVEVLRNKNSASALRYDDLDNRLLEIGMCSACAGNAADIYIKHPSSKCGKVVKRALEGDTDSQAALTANPDYCIEK
jgi:hypothetical protein